MTLRNLTFFPASQFAVLQPFQGFVTFAFLHDLHFYWYLHDFVVVFMNLQWSKHSFLSPYIKKKKQSFCIFSLASLCQRAKLFQSRILGHIASPHKTVYVISNLLIGHIASPPPTPPHTISSVTTCDVATIPEIPTA